MDIGRIGIIAIIMSVWFCSAFSAETYNKSLNPEDVVINLYHDFGEGIQGGNNKRLLDQPLDIYKQYFTTELASKIVEDRLYEVNNKELGHINFVLIYGSQDPDGINNVSISRKIGSNNVLVHYDYNKEKDVMEIDYFMESTKSGWRISNIVFKTRISTSFPSANEPMSLINLLSKPY
jgi:hypothetical protein